MVFNENEERVEIEGVRVVTETKYLGVTVVTKRNMYEKQRADGGEGKEDGKLDTLSVREKLP